MRAALGVLLTALGLSSWCCCHVSGLPPPTVSMEVTGIPGEITSLSEINDILHHVGAHLSVFDDVSASIVPVLNDSLRRPLKNEELDEIMASVKVDRDEVKRQRALAGRVCNYTLDCDEFSSGEVGLPPYPKIYSLSNMDTATRAFWGFKLGKLHVNAAPSTTGRSRNVFTDEVHTLLAGGPNYWHQSLGWGKGVARIHMGEVLPGVTAGWRITFPGSNPHAGMFTKSVQRDTTVCVSHIVGPPTWFMTYNLNGIEDPALGDNPWIDFSNPEFPAPREAKEAGEAYKKMLDYANALPVPSKEAVRTALV